MSQATNFGLAPAGPATGAQVAARANESFSALLSSHSGTTAPGYAVAGTRWLDTSVSTAWAMKVYDGTDWHTEWVLNPTTNQFSDPSAAAGSIVQSVSAEYTTWSTVTALIPLDDTIPQSGEGTQLVTVSITPKFQNSKIRLRGHVPLVSPGGTAVGIMALFRSGQANALRMGYLSASDGQNTLSGTVFGEDSPNTTSAVTYSLRLGPTAGSMYINGNSTGRLMGGTAAVSLLAEEIKQ